MHVTRNFSRIHYTILLKKRTVADKGLQNFSLDSSALSAFEQRVLFINPRLLWQFLRFHPKHCPICPYYNQHTYDSPIVFLPAAAIICLSGVISKAFTC